jgi:hypothetical protein
MAAAIFGLIGTLVGGLVTWLSAYLLDRRREARAARVAEAVLWSELDQARVALSDVRKGGKWPPGWGWVDWTASWRTHREALATKLDTKQFESVACCYVRMAQFQAGLSAGCRDLDGDDEQFLSDVSDALHDTPIRVHLSR